MQESQVTPVQVYSEAASGLFCASTDGSEKADQDDRGSGEIQLC